MKNATLKDVAREAEVSIASASRAINGLDNVADDMRARVLEVASRLRYVPHSGARSLARAQTNTIGLLLPDIHGEFFSEIIRGVDAAARKHGLHLLVSGSHGDMSEAVAALSAMSGRVDGLLVMSPFVDSRDLIAALPMNLPLVTISSRIDQISHGSIAIDNFMGALIGARHLVAQGCRSVAHIGGPANNYEAVERLRGYEAAISEAGITTRLIELGDFSEDSGYQAMKSLMAADALLEAVFVANDMMAVGALLAAREAGLKVPEDVAIVGFDDIPIARFTHPPLTTIRAGVHETGRLGLELLRKAILGEAPSSLVISPELVVRESSVRKANRITGRPIQTPGSKG